MGINNRNMNCRQIKITAYEPKSSLRNHLLYDKISSNSKRLRNLKKILSSSYSDHFDEVTKTTTGITECQWCEVLENIKNRNILRNFLLRHPKLLKTIFQTEIK